MHSRAPVSDRSIGAFRRRIYRFYNAQGRSLPWRETGDPYHVLVSEFMLQQTRVDRVIEKYPRFIAAFPDLPFLARAPFREVLHGWEGLGYNRRALFLKKSAETVVARYGGRIPSDPADLIALPGIGPATAASIAVFAFNAPLIFIETNVRTVFLHTFFPEGRGIMDSALLPLIGRALDRQNPARWYNALMDYGSMLKKKFGNPGRRSAHYSRQAPFPGSNRQIRGLILKLLNNAGGLSEAILIDRVGQCPEKVRRMIASLQREGFLREERGRYEIA